MQETQGCTIAELETETGLQIVYILINPSMPGLLKIGRTTNLDARVAALSSATGVPEPFQIAYAAYVENAPFVERALHSAFSLHKMPGREFFRLSVASAIAALSLAEVRPVTLTVDDEPATIVAEVKERGARKRFPDIIEVLQNAKTSLSNRELAAAMGVSDGEASKRRAEVEHLLDVQKIGKECRISLKAY